jgi:hypothetical protein
MAPRIGRILDGLLSAEGRTPIRCPRCGEPSPGVRSLYVVLPRDHPDGDARIPLPECRRCGAPLGRDGRSLALRRLVVPEPGAPESS